VRPSFDPRNRSEGGQVRTQVALADSFFSNVGIALG